jgi:hypothetical protein
LVERYELEDDQLNKNFIEQVENELYEVEQESYQLLERLRAIQDQHARLDVRAPVSGVVVNMVAHTVGGVISPGSPILDIVPKNDELMLEAQVRPSDIDGVKAGLVADLRFPGFNATDIPEIDGHGHQGLGRPAHRYQRHSLLSRTCPGQRFGARAIGRAQPHPRDAGRSPHQQEGAHSPALSALAMAHGIWTAFRE